MIPKGWSSQKLSSVASIIDCKHRTPEYVKSGIPLVSPGTIKWGALDLISPVKRVTEEEYRSLMDHCVVEQGDLVMSRNQSVGVVSYVDSKKPFVLGQDTVLIKAIHADWRFIYYTLQSDLVQRQIAKSAGGSTFSRINLSDIRALNIKTPAICEQDKISQILTAWDKAISVTESLLANSQQQKKALMQQLLTGKKRLLDENGTRFSETWKLYALSELFQRVTTKNNGKSNNVVTISGQHGLIKQEDFFKKTVASDTLDGYFLLKKGQFAYNKSYSNGYPMGAIKRLNRYPEGVVTTLYICFELTTPKKSCGDYWEHYFESGLLNNSLSQIAHEGGRAHGLLNVKPSDFFSLKVAVPGFEEQQKIASVLSAADTEISTLEKKLACLKDEKKALMQQLLTGKRRVKVDEAVAV
ncbi:TPA: restriction endonuclease subunit S [Escherichia coli]|uniref:restriction endonuclease subunit S n=3 Tax=Enterobacteriaceae TaxID=543 RepID=UPI00140DF6C4|nr:restriction endonuclease subunit S [Escherichia coli]EGO4566725.1 restriction endonuclease subunit S [Escherichia coli]EIY4388175.1 restriction endonuclease subunit S [Escherichia coli]NHR03348.1 restriction endonuclease subunit S [Escherichia coli]HDX6377281.1 restriction endonuclease subunit S [Escherichia coli]HDX7340273.1 restriction endonuclease subunit S [Escherichia coli]